MIPELTKEELDEMLKDPRQASSFELSRKFGEAVRKHFKGGPADSKIVMSAALGAISGELARLPKDRREAAITRCVQHIAYTGGYLDNEP